MKPINPRGLSLFQLTVLKAAQQTDGGTKYDLARHLDADTAAVTRALNLLIRFELIWVVPRVRDSDLLVYRSTDDGDELLAGVSWV